MGSSNKIANGVFWSIIANSIYGVYGFVSVPILINYFGKSEYGLIGLAFSVNIYLQLMDMGFNTTNLRFYSNWLAKDNKEKTNKLFQSSLLFYGCIGAVNALVLFVVSLFSDRLFGLSATQDSILKQLIYILMASAFVNWFSSCFDQLIKATENVAWCLKRALLPKAIQIVILFGTVYLDFSITTYFLLTTFAVFSIIPLSIRKIRLETPFVSFVPRLHWPILKETLPYCLNVFSLGIFQFSFYNLRPVFLGIQGSIESVADYRILNGITAIVTTFSGVFMPALLPSSTRVVAREDKNTFDRIVYAGTKYTSIMCSFCCFGLMAVSREVVSLYVGLSYLYLVPWLNLWLLCTLVNHNQAIYSLILSGTNLRPITYGTAASSLISLTAAWLLIPEYQVGGTVIAFIIYVSIHLLFYYLYYWPYKMRLDSWRIFSRCFAPTTVFGGALATVGIMWNSENVSIWMSFITKSVLFFVFFVIGTYLLFDKDDKEFISNLAYRKFKRNIK